MSKRLDMLERLVKVQGERDPFAWYGLALEYRRLERVSEALSVFRELRQASPEYLPQYLMAAQVLLEQQEAAEAREWLGAGVELAKRQGNAKALGELEELLDGCPTD